MLMSCLTAPFATMMAAPGRCGKYIRPWSSAETRAAFAEELSNAIARLTAKYHDETAPGGRGFRFLAAIHPTPATPKQEPRDERDHD